ncbi:MAG: PAS domain S-box protein, partial [Chloroflexi bacterium]|nr:PAS domain S-box protein [Chloroflexota bacterium]
TEGIIEVIDDYGARPSPSQSLISMGMQSMVLLPVKAGEQTLGLVTVISKDKNHFNPALVHLLTSVGEGLGVLLENSLLQEATENSRQAQIHLADENAVIAEIGQILGSSMNIKEGFQVFAQKTLSLVPFDQLDITVINPSGEYDEVVYSTASKGEFGQSTPIQGSITERVTSDLTGLIIQGISFGKICLEYPCLSSSLINGNRSWLVVPLIHNGAGIGALFLASSNRSAFSQDDLDLISKLGLMIAGAISNSSHHAQQMKAEQALREREARLRGIVESAVDGIITIDEVGIVESFNFGAEKIFGFSSAEVLGNNIKMLMPAPHYAAHDGYLSAYKKTGIKKIIGSGREVTGRRKDGTEFPMDLSVSVVELEDRTIYTGIIRDITGSKSLQMEIEQRAKELEVAYAELKTLDRMKDEFIATVSHELRTPLTSIKGAAEILLNYQDEDRATQTEFLTIIDNESDRLTRLINDVLDLARMESGETVWDISSVSLQNIIETAMDSTHALTLNKKVTVDVASADELPAVEADSDKLVQVVTNLLSNAIKFTPSGGSINVRSRLVPDADAVTGVKMIEVSVADTGIGIPTGEIHKIFNRFQQAGSPLSDRPQGTGLGLAISKEIITHLGGEIWVKSELGEGSTFFFTVPMVPIPV